MDPNNPVKDFYDHYYKIVSNNLSQKLFLPLTRYDNLDFDKNKDSVCAYFASKATLKHFVGQDVDLSDLEDNLEEYNNSVKSFVSDLLDSWVIVSSNRNKRKDEDEKICKTRIDVCERLSNVFELFYSSEANDAETFLMYVDELYGEIHELFSDMGQIAFLQYYNIIRKNLLSEVVFAPVINKLKEDGSKRDPLFEYLASKSTSDFLVDHKYIDASLTNNPFNHGLRTENAKVAYDFVNELINGWKEIILDFESKIFEEASDELDAEIQACILLKDFFNKTYKSLANEHFVLGKVVDDIYSNRSFYKAYYLIFFSMNKDNDYQKMSKVRLKTINNKHVHGSRDCKKIRPWDKQWGKKYFRTDQFEHYLDTEGYSDIERDILFEDLLDDYNKYRKFARAFITSKKFFPKTAINLVSRIKKPLSVYIASNLFNKYFSVLNHGLPEKKLVELPPAYKPTEEGKDLFNNYVINLIDCITEKNYKPHDLPRYEVRLNTCLNLVSVFDCYSKQFPDDIITKDFISLFNKKLDRIILDCLSFLGDSIDELSINSKLKSLGYLI